MLKGLSEDDKKLIEEIEDLCLTPEKRSMYTDAAEEFSGNEEKILFLNISRAVNILSYFIGQMPRKDKSMPEELNKILAMAHKSLMSKKH